MKATAPEKSPADGRNRPARDPHPPVREDTARLPSVTEPAEARQPVTKPTGVRQPVTEPTDLRQVEDEPTGPGPLVPTRRRRGVSDNFRLVGSHRPAPPDDRLLGIWAWATGLGVLGLGSALRGLTAITTGGGPSWYEPALAGIGLGGVTLIGVAILSTGRTRLPWIMLGLATVPFILNLALTIGAL